MSLGFLSPLRRHLFELECWMILKDFFFPPSIASTLEVVTSGILRYSEKREKLNKLLSQFGPHRHRFLIKELAELTGTLNFLAECSSWSRFCYVRIPEALITSCQTIYHALRHKPEHAELFRRLDDV